MYTSPNVVQLIRFRRMRRAGYVARMGEERRIQVLVRKLEGKRPLGKQKHRGEDKINMDHQELESGGVNWIELAQDRDRWRALLTAVISLGFDKMREIS